MQYFLKSLTLLALTATTAAYTAAGIEAAQAAPSRQVDANAKTPGWATVQKIVQTFKGASRFDQSDKAGRAAMADLIDFKQIAERALTPSEWQSLTAAQRQELASTIQTLLERRYYPRWKRIFGKGEIAYAGESKGEVKGDLLVATNLRLGQKSDPLTWQLSSDAGKSRVISLAVNQKDLLKTLHQRIEARRTKGGYSAMVAWLKGKGKFEKNDATASGADESTVAKVGDKKCELAASKNAPKSGSLID